MGELSKSAPVVGFQTVATLRKGDFSPLWAGQAAALGRAMPAAKLTRTLAAEALERMRRLAS
jgi:hypothetical protein